MSSGTTTSRTLLQRLKDPGDQEAWEAFHGLYAPLIEGYARGLGLGLDDAEEVRDDCLAALVEKLESFDYNPEKGGFQAWLRRLTQGRVIDRLRRVKMRSAEDQELHALTDPALSPDEVWLRTWRREHVRFALREVRTRVSEQSFQAFELLLLHGWEVPDVCVRMGMNSNQVYKAKARVLDRIRGVLERLDAGPGLLEE